MPAARSALLRLLPTRPLTRSGVESTAIGMRCTAEPASVRRPRAADRRRRGSRAVPAGAAPTWSRGGRARDRHRVPLAVPRLTIGRTSAVTAAISALPTPARRSNAFETVARRISTVISTRGRSGASASGCTSARHRQHGAAGGGADRQRRNACGAMLCLARGQGRCAATGQRHHHGAERQRVRAEAEAGREPSHQRAAADACHRDRR